MTTVKAGVEYKIEYDDASFLLDEKKFNLLTYINESGSITEAAKRSKISYRTALNYISKIESTLNISIVNTSKGGVGGGGSTTLSKEGLQILKECKKINAIIELHNDINEEEAEVIAIDNNKKTMTIKINDKNITLKINEDYKVGDKVLALISYEDIFLMVDNKFTNATNVFKGIITEMKLEKNLVRVKIDIGFDLYSNISILASNNLNLSLGKEIYIGFRDLSVATLKL